MPYTYRRYGLSKLRSGLLFAISLALLPNCGSNAENAESDRVVRYQTTSSVAPLRTVLFTRGDRRSFFVSAIDQESDGATVLVREAVITGSAGWVVVHADDRGGPGTVIGISAQLPPGRSTDVPVALNIPLQGTTRVHPMLHLEDNNTITCEFPSADAPVKLRGKLVVSPIAVRVT